jgi:hypothetical protein
MRGLDPRIHLLGMKPSSKWMDGRVKPGHDGEIFLRFAEG